MNKRILDILKYILFLAVGVGLLYMAFKGNDPGKMMEDIKNANYWWVSFAVVLGILAYVFRALRWIVLLEPMGYKPSAMASYHSVAIGYFANLALPRMGEVVRCTVMNQSSKVPLNTLIGTVLLERLIDVLMLILLIVCTILLNMELFGGFILKILGDSLSGMSYFPLLLASTAGVALLLILFLLRNALKKIPVVLKIKNFISGIANGFLSIRNIRRKWLFMLYTLLIWLCYFLMTYFCLFSTEPTSLLTPVDGLFIMIAGGLGMTAPVQGGIGAYHYIVKLALGVLGVVPVLNEQTGELISDPGLVYATVIHSSQAIMAVVMGCVSLVLISFAKRGGAISSDGAQQGDGGG